MRHTLGACLHIYHVRSTVNTKTLRDPELASESNRVYPTRATEVPHGVRELHVGNYAQLNPPTPFSCEPLDGGCIAPAVNSENTVICV